MEKELRDGCQALGLEVRDGLFEVAVAVAGPMYLYGTTGHSCDSPDCPCYLRGRESIVRERHEAEASGYVPPPPED